MIESKLTQFFETIVSLKNKKIARVYLFGRFARLYDPLLKEELHYYFDTLPKLEDNFHGKD